MDMEETKKMIDRLRALDAAATVQLLNKDPEDFRAKNADLEGKELPLTLYETVNIYHDDEWVKAEVKEIKVTRFGISHELGATLPSIDFVGSDGRKSRGSVDMFYCRKEDAQVEVDLLIAMAEREKASEELKYLVLAHLPLLLNAAEREINNANKTEE
jgi:hypothetical protein